MARRSTLAYSYLRVNGRGQVEGHGFDRQRQTISKYARANRCEIVEEFRDEGVSGAREWEDCPALADLMARVIAGGVRLVLVEHADRLARDLMTNEVILAQFREAGVRVVAAESGSDLTVGDADPTAVLIRQIFAVIAQFEKNRLVVKLRAGRTRARMLTGQCEGRKPFGALPGEPGTIEKIIQLRKGNRGKRRLSFAAIGSELSASGIHPRGTRRYREAVEVAVRQQTSPPPAPVWKAGTIHEIIKRHRPHLLG